MYDYTQDNLSIATSCTSCLALDQKCDECSEVSEARLADRAWELVDEGNLTYRLTLSYSAKEPSNHDWTDRDGEFLPPIHLIADGGELDNLWELDDLTQYKREVICQWCHLTTPSMVDTCQSCDKVLA